ncbi:hypothetical protein PMKS-001956 [Pichia membranifaciens]|uniref:Uncharacterized protein n=1 Tax=Pichia membranifaciens TaxID=4926 RepID=A0A1Q2YG82_9ASCO|nr:hypothetical protein PMKS-001956 [Pichia membranifaciens]
MKFLNYLFLSEFIVPAFSLVLAKQPNGLGDSNRDELSHATAHGIFKTILDNREFGSTFVKFSEWKSPSGEIYVVPSAEEDADMASAALGLGYRFIRNDNSVVQSSDIANVVKIEEKNISAAGFPLGWLKHDDSPTADDFFPFGSKKFMRIGVNKNSPDQHGTDEMVKKEEANEDEEEDGGTSSEDEDTSNFGLFHWFEDEDDCNVNEKTNKLLNTDQLLFAGVGDIDMQPEIEQRDLETSTRLLTVYTTTTVTSVHGITITQTADPTTTHNEKWVSTSTTDLYNDETNSDYSEDGSDESTEIATLTDHEPFTFTTPVTTHEHLENPQTESEVISTSENNIPTGTWTLEIITSIIDAEGKPSETLAEYTKTTPVWTSPESWNSYPFSVTETEHVEQPATSSLTFENTTISVTSTFVHPSSKFSSFKQFETSSSYKNNTMSSKSSGADESIYTRTKVTNASLMTTSENLAHSQGGYWASLFGLILAVFSGVILI